MTGLHRHMLAPLLVLGASSVLAPAGGQPPAGGKSQAVPRQPNIVMIFTDDQRADSLGCTAHPFVKTPNIDSLAREGIRFDNMFVITSLCCPSRATVLSGLYTHLTGVSENGQDLSYDASTPYLPRLLKEAGYTTAFIGKYHMGKKAFPRPDFDYWAAMDQNGGRGKYIDPRLNINGKVTASVGHSTDVLSGLALDWLKERQDKPFFLLLSLRNLHFPWTPPPRHAGMYRDAPVELPASFNDSLDLLPGAGGEKQYTKLTGNLINQFSDRKVGVTQFVRDYARMVPSIDENVGLLIQQLKKSGLYDNTVFLYSSDNGFLLGEHGLVRKGLFYEPSIRVPLLIRYPPRLPAGVRVDAQALNLDLAPTLLDLAGVPRPMAMQGRSLIPVARGEQDSWRQDWLFMEQYPEGGSPPLLAVRGERWKYVRAWGETVEEELFDLAGDPGERRNLAGEAAHGSRLETMRRRMKELLLEVKAPGEWMAGPATADPSSQ
ncbi:MAG: sulfatase [Acidobacteria bacterium]|nr:sulfatase [Acidobacteriota bacterium]